MMNVGTRKKIFFGVLAVLVFGACSLLDGAPSNNGADLGEPTLILSPTPNLTLTAVFSQIPTDVPAEETEVPTADASMEDPTTTPEAEVTEPAETALPTVDYAETPAAAVEGKVEAQFLNNAPTIDGLLTDWAGEMYSMTEIVYGSEYFANVEDLSGQFKVGWDEDNLYLGVVVYDTRFAQTASGTQMYMGDSLEILLDTNLAGDSSVTELSRG